MQRFCRAVIKSLGLWETKKPCTWPRLVETVHLFTNMTLAGFVNVSASWPLEIFVALIPLAVSISLPCIRGAHVRVWIWKRPDIYRVRPIFRLHVVAKTPIQTVLSLTTLIHNRSVKKNLLKIGCENRNEVVNNEPGHTHRTMHTAALFSYTSMKL